MYYRQINPWGCLFFTIILVWLFVKLKLYYILGFLILLALAYKFFQKTKVKIAEHKEEKEKNFEPEIGEVYKICPYCGNNVKRSANVCPHCKNQI